ncbi:hypothetical protein K438DRAFT_593806 [Mycena galopus ATCC 62051]|nr:hypothetical protein K438DRAFT_593806 [Mycena galopus ATCC 62051]
MAGPIDHQQIHWSRELFLYCVAAEWFLYGIYVVLFCFCVKTLRKCRLRHRLALSIAISVIFVFCTLHWILQLVNAGELLTVLEKKANVHGLKGVNPNELMERWNQINIVMGTIYVLSNLIADSIFIYRCYCIWDFRKEIIAVPIVLLIASGCLGFASIIVCGKEGYSEFLFITWVFPLAVVFSVLTNVMLMALTAGRIWWIARGARVIVGPAVVKQYRMVIAMMSIRIRSALLHAWPAVSYFLCYPAFINSSNIRGTSTNSGNRSYNHRGARWNGKQRRRCRQFPRRRKFCTGFGARYWA